MGPIPIVILPGLDGTDLLLDRFVSVAPAGTTVRVVSIPDDPADDYESLCARLVETIRSLAPCHLLCESFSGPIGIMLAARYPEFVTQLTLVASFAIAPFGWPVRYLPWSILFRWPLPTWAVRHWFVGSDLEMALKLQTAIARTSTATLARRVQCVLSVDVRAELAKVVCPVTFLRATGDRLVPVNSLTSILDIKPDIAVREIDGPHLILQTRPEFAWRAILL